MHPPAYSSPFATHTLQVLQPIEILDTITRAWAWGGSTGRGVRVAIIDSGVDATHPAVGGIVNGYVAIQEDPAQPEHFLYDTAPHDDVYGHGTACAGIIRSLAPECEIYSVRVLGANLGGRGSVFAAGLRWAIENKMHVCNLSLSTSNRKLFGPLHELADQAYYQGILLVAAANNIPLPCFPALYASVVSVGSHGINNPQLFYYNPQPPVEFGAWGINVRVAWMNGGWLTATGNSFAAPHIAGLLTRILGKHPGLTPFQAKVVLRALAANVTREAADEDPGGTAPPTHDGDEPARVAADRAEGEVAA